MPNISGGGILGGQSIAALVAQSNTQGQEQTVTYTPPAQYGLPPQDQEVIINSDGVPVKRPKRRKAYSSNNNDVIQTIYALPDPRILGLTEIEQFLVHHPYLTTKEPYPMAAPKVLVGVEVEVENVLKLDPNTTLLFWQSKEDHSLRNRGYEFVTPGVIPAGQVEPALKQLFGGLNSDVDFSARTSIHVHVDVRQLTLNQLVGFLLVYTALENLLFKYAGLNRRTNIFCVPLTETGLFESLASDPAKFIWSIESYWSKYTALNLLPITNFGSVEFRHLPGTKNLKQVLGWIDLITRLKLYVYKYSLQTIIGQISELNGNSRYKQFVEGVFGDASIFLDLSNLIGDMEKPVYIVKNSIISNDFNHNVISNPQQDSILGDLLNGWAKGLSQEQHSALQQLCKLWKNPNHEQVFRDMVKRPKNYLESHPQHASLINKVLMPKQVETKEVKAKKQMPFGFDTMPLNAVEWNAIYNNEGNHI